MLIGLFSSTVDVRTETMTETLDEVFFPSVVVCNVSPLRKSFMFDVLNHSRFSDNAKLGSEVWTLILVKTWQV